jgi:hypothetical protein
MRLLSRFRRPVLAVVLFTSILFPAGSAHAASSICYKTSVVANTNLNQYSFVSAGFSYTLGTPVIAQSFHQGPTYVNADQATTDYFYDSTTENITVFSSNELDTSVTVDGYLVSDYTC